MGRMPRAEDRSSSQRATAEFRAVEAEKAELARKLESKEHECRDAMDDRNHFRARAQELQEELDRVAPISLDGKRSAIGKLEPQSTPFYEQVDFLHDCLKRYHATDVATVTVAALRKLGRSDETTDYCWQVLQADGMRNARKELLHREHVKVADHLSSNVYTSRHFSILRLVGTMSKRVCGLIEQSIKWRHEADGTKSRQMLCPGSRVPAPSLFAIAGINEAEAEAERASQLHLQEHSDRKGADICGKPYGLDRAFFDSLQNTSRAGGMATQGTKEDPHIFCVTGDGAGLTARDSGVRVAHFPGSTNLLNQSSQDVVNWLFYKEACKAEDYTILEARLKSILPDLRRIYQTQELAPDGKPCGIFVKLVLVADKPFIRHVCGMLSHNADAFGAPFCTCCDEDDTSTLYDYTFDKHTHYGNTSFGDLCHRAHVAVWEALGQREPPDWRFKCPCCGEIFDSKKGGKKKLEALDAKIAELGADKAPNLLKKHAKNHAAQQLRRFPLLPFHHVVFDPMHGVHNEGNVLLDEAIHKHLMVDSPDPAVKKVIEAAQEKINGIWKAANLPKFIQFGKDRQGAHSHAVNGPAFKAVFRHPDLIIKTIEDMQPVYELLETKKLTPELGASATGTGADRGPQAGNKKRTSKDKGAAAPKKSRNIVWECEREPESAAKAPEGEASTAAHAETAPNLTYSQRVGVAFVAFIQFYLFLHSDHDKMAKDLNTEARSARGDQAVQLAITMQRGMLALIGTHRRRTYAHDLVYGTWQLYMLFGKPWNAATEGNEHAHQDMKSFFHSLACHGGRGAHGDCYAVLRLTVVKQQTLRDHWHLLPTTQYAAMRANRTLQTEATCVEGKKRGRESGVKGERTYTHDARMEGTAEKVQSLIVDQCSPCGAESQG